MEGLMVKRHLELPSKYPCEVPTRLPADHLSDLTQFRRTNCYLSARRVELSHNSRPRGLTHARRLPRCAGPMPRAGQSPEQLLNQGTGQSAEYLPGRESHDLSRSQIYNVHRAADNNQQEDGRAGYHYKGGYTVKHFLPPAPSAVLPPW